MKISTLFLFLLIFCLHAENTNSQNVRVTVRENNIELKKVLNEIEKQTDYLFVYDKYINVNQRVSINLNKRPLKEVLKQLFDGTDMKYSLDGDYIVLSRREIEKPTVEVTQQNKRITGIVVDETGIAIAGANVVIKGTTNGTITDANGKFSIDVPASSVLQISFIGYITQDLSIGNKNNFNIKLSEDTQKLEGVVVVGYGTQKKRDVIGSVATVKADEIVKTSSMSVTTALIGKASGLNISQSAAGTKVQIRGTHSINSGNDPLWIIDGVPGGSDVNPQDIESIEVLKDASATAIYGSRGSNGVIMITTKKGEKNATHYNVSYQGSLRKQIKNFSDYGYADINQWYAIMDQVTKNSGVSEFQPVNILKEFSSSYAYTDLTREQSMSSDAGKLMDYLTQTGFSNQINFSMTSGNDKGSSYMSVNYTNDKSVLKNNNSDAVNFRLNGDYNVLPLLKMGIRSYVKMGRSKGIDNSSERRVVWKPLTYESDPYNTGYWNSFGNPLAACDPKYSRSDSEFLSANLSGYADLDLGFLTKGLGFRSELNYSRYSNGNSGWTSELIGSAPETAAYGSYGTETTNFGKSILYNFYLKYNRSFGNHNVNAVLGTESERSMGYYRYAKGRNTEGSYPQLGDNPGEKIASSGYQSGEDYLRSYFGRLDYKFKDRYLAGISLRRDGASNFAPKKRWGTFTAYSLGWIINEESFLKDQKWISLLKLRGSAGQTGNKAVPNKFYTTWQSNLWWFYGEYGPASIGGTRPTNIGNSELTWETTTSYDFGLDYSFFNNKLNGSLGYYLQDVKGLVLAAQLPTSTGLGTSNEIWGNMGRIQNYGLEFSLTSVNVSTKDFQWTTNFNFTTNKNKVKALTPDLDNNNLPLYETKNGIQTISKTGHGIREFYMCESAGVDPERGVEMIYEIDYDLWKKTGEIVKTGRKIPATVDNINRNKVNLGKSTIPKFFGGINNTLQYRDFDMNFLITFAGGNYLYDTERYFISYPLRGQYNLDKALLTESWQKPGDNAKYPQLVYNETFPYDWDPEVANSESPTGKGNWKSGNGNYLVSGSAAPLSKFVEKAGYARLKHVEFGYTLPTLLSKKAWISSLRLFVSGDDLLTLTPYKGWDPVSGDITNGVLAITNLSPSFKVWASYNFGIQIKF